VSNPGIGPYVEGYHTALHHTYYQWVPLVLALTAVSFYVPRFIWKACEGGVMSNLCKDLMFEKDTENRIKDVEKIRCATR